MLAALNQPNICAIYGFDEADGVRFLILELVEGDTLAHAAFAATIGSSKAVACRSHGRWPSPGRSPTPSKPRTTKASSTAT